MRLVAWLNECHRNEETYLYGECRPNLMLYSQHVQLGQSQILLMLLRYKPCIKCNPKTIELKFTRLVIFLSYLKIKTKCHSWLS